MTKGNDLLEGNLKGILVIILAAGAAGGIAMILGLRNPLVLGIVAGFLLALINFYVSVFLSSRTKMRSIITSGIIIISGFVFRLTVLGVIFYGLSKISLLNIVAVLITFLVSFTILLVWEVTFFIRGRFQS